MIEKINQIVSQPFENEDELLKFYQNCLPNRINDFRLDEVGPIMSVGSKQEIEGYLKNSFYFNGIGMSMGENIDWYGTPNGDLEWNGGFVRQGYFMYLADEYTKTKDEKYAKTIIEHMLDYIKKMPPYNPDGKPYLEYKKSTWRPFEVAGRAAENWPVALAQIICSKSMTASAFAQIFYSIYEHAVFLSIHHWRTGNHACLEVAGLGVLTIFFKEFKKADEWRTYCVDFLMHMLDEEFHLDGYTKEMSGAYHYIAMRNFFAFYQVALHNKKEDIFPKTYVDYIKKAALAEFYQQKPDYSLPITNDSNVTTCHKKILEKFYCLIDNDMLDYRLSNTTKGKKPPHTSFYFDDARIAIMRSGFEENAVYASFDMGRWGTNHMNEDQLNFELSAYGRNLLLNCGRWRYTTSPGVEWVSKAQYFKTTAAYNSLICDDMCQMPTDAQGEMKISDTFDYAKGTFEGGYGIEATNEDEQLLKTKGVTSGKICKLNNTCHTREVFFAKPAFFIIRDTIKTSGNHKATQIWHMGEGSVSQCGNAVYSNFDDANFVMAQLGTPQLNIYEGSETPFKGWTCPKYDDLQPAPELNFSLSGTDTIVFETLIYPIKGAVNKTKLPLFSKAEANGKTIYTVEHDGKKVKIEAFDNCYLVKE